MNYTLIAISISLILLAISYAISQSYITVVYERPKEVDVGICDTITTNVAVYWSRTLNRRASEDFLRQNIEVAEEYNKGFRVLGYEIVAMSSYILSRMGYVEVNVVYNMSWGQHNSRCYFYVRVVNLTTILDPVTGLEYYNITIECLTDRERPLLITSPQEEVKVSYAISNLWTIIAPTSYSSIVLEDWRGIRVEFRVPRGG